MGCHKSSLSGWDAAAALTPKKTCRPASPVFNPDGGLHNTSLRGPVSPPLDPLRAVHIPMCRLSCRSSRRPWAMACPPGMTRRGHEQGARKDLAQLQEGPGNPVPLNLQIQSSEPSSILSAVSGALLGSPPRFLSSVPRHSSSLGPYHASPKCLFLAGTAQRKGLPGFQGSRQQTPCVYLA